MARGRSSPPRRTHPRASVRGFAPAPAPSASLSPGALRAPRAPRGPHAWARRRLDQNARAPSCALSGRRLRSSGRPGPDSQLRRRAHRGPARNRLASKRRGRDSNPRGTGMAPNGFQDRRIQPLCHPSILRIHRSPAARATGGPHPACPLCGPNGVSPPGRHTRAGQPVSRCFRRHADGSP
jgi:hypothetical protein